MSYVREFPFEQAMMTDTKVILSPTLWFLSSKDFHNVHMFVKEAQAIELDSTRTSRKYLGGLFEIPPELSECKPI